MSETEKKSTSATSVNGGIKPATLTPFAPKSPRELLEGKVAAVPVAASSVAAGPVDAFQDAPVTQAPIAVQAPVTQAPIAVQAPITVQGPVAHEVSGRTIPPSTTTSTLISAGVPPSPAAKTTAAVGAKAPGIAPHTLPAAGSSSSVKPAVVKKPAQSFGALVDRMGDLLDLDAKAPPPGLKGGSTNRLHHGYLHVLVYGEPNTYKTTTAAEFGGPEDSFIIVTRRSEQLIPLARKGYRYVEVEDAESLRWSLLHPEKAAAFAAQRILEETADVHEGQEALAWAERWAKNPNRVVIVDDLTEGTNVLKEDYSYIYHEKGELAGQTTRIKDPRQAYKKAGDELHDLLKINLGRPQHVILIAVDKSFDVEGTIDNRTEPDMPNKMMKLVETELEYVFFFPHGNDMQTKTSKVVRQAQLEGKKEAVVWNEITFAKCKLPIEYLGQGVVKEKEPKNLRKVWTQIQLAMKGEWKPGLTPSTMAGAGQQNQQKSTAPVSKPSPVAPVAPPKPTTTVSNITGQQKTGPISASSVKTPAIKV